MRTSRRTCASVLMATLFPIVSWSQANDYAAPFIEHLKTSVHSSTVFVNVNIAPMDSERIVRGQTVVVQDGVISAIGPDQKVDIPAGAMTIDGNGKYLIPGLVDMHFHMPGPEEKPETIEAFLFFFVANGVTTVRSTIGQSNHIEIRDRIRSRELFGPTLYVACPPLRDDSVRTPEQAREYVKRYKTQGYDQIKNYGISDSAAYEAAATACREAGLTFFGHVSKQMSIHRAIALGQSVEHLQGYYKEIAADSGQLYLLALETKQAGIWNCPTQLWEEYLCEANIDTLLAYEGVQFMPRAAVDAWVEAKRKDIQKYLSDTNDCAERLALRRRIIKTFYDAGARLVIGSDSPGKFRIPGFAIYDEMRAFARAGLTPYEILECATRSAAEYFGESNRAGTIAVGKRADLVLLNANPLEDIDNLCDRAGVMLNGAWLTRQELEVGVKYYSLFVE